MSDYYKPSKYTPYQLDTQWLNNVNGIHDLFCFCEKPWMHFTQALLQRSSYFELSPKEQRILQKCLTTMATKEGDTHENTEDTTGDRTDQKDGFDLDIGDLEKLFENDDIDG